MNFLEFKDAKDMMQKTGLTPVECLKLIDAELKNIGEKENGSGNHSTLQK